MIFKPILEERANALLFSEDTVNFYQYNVSVKPSDGINFALAYLLRILTILLNYNQNFYKDLSKAMNKTIHKVYSVSGENLKKFDRDCHEIVQEFEESCKS